MAFVVGTYARSPAAPLQQMDLAALRKALQIGPTDSADFTCTPRLQLAWVTLDGSVGAPDKDEDGSLALLWGALFRDGHDDVSNRKLLRDEAGKDSPKLTTSAVISDTPCTTPLRIHFACSLTSSAFARCLCAAQKTACGFPVHCV